MRVMKKIKVKHIAATMLTLTVISGILFSGIKNIPQSCWQDQQFSAGYCHGKVDIYISLYILCL